MLVLLGWLQSLSSAFGARACARRISSGGEVSEEAGEGADRSDDMENPFLGSALQPPSQTYSFNFSGLCSYPGMLRQLLPGLSGCWGRFLPARPGCRKMTEN